MQRLGEASQLSDSELLAKYTCVLNVTEPKEPGKWILTIQYDDLTFNPILLVCINETKCLTDKTSGRGGAVVRILERQSRDPVSISGFAGPFFRATVNLNRMFVI